MKYLKIGKKSYVISVSMATMTFQYDGYLSFKLMQLENEFSDPYVLFEKTISHSTMNYLINLKNFC